METLEKGTTALKREETAVISARKRKWTEALSKEAAVDLPGRRGEEKKRKSGRIDVPEGRSHIRPSTSYNPQFAVGAEREGRGEVLVHTGRGKRDLADSESGTGRVGESVGEKRHGISF